MKNGLLMVGAGDIGRRILAQLPRREHPVAVTSSPHHRGALRSLRARPVLANLDKPRSLTRLPQNWKGLIHAAPPPTCILTDAARDPRTRNLLRSPAVRRRQAGRVLVYLSTSGVYGDCGGARISEAQPVNPQSVRARRRVDAERVLSRAARRGLFQLVILRVPGIYAADRLPLARLAAGTPALLPEQDVYTNHIHAADLARITLAALHRARQRVRPAVRIYHASDDGEMKMGEYFDLVADAFGLARPPRLPRSELAGAVSPMLLSFMRESRRLDNQRMKRELRVRLQFPTAAEGVAAAASCVTSQT